MTDNFSAAPALKVRDTEIDFAFVVRLTCAAMLITILVKWPSYLPGHRVYAMAPLLSFMAQLPDWAALIVYGLCCALLIWLFIAPDQSLPATGIMACVAFWVLQDVNRMQPYHYLFCYVFLISILSRQQKANGLDAIRTMVCGVYFWAGFHKINATFFFNIFPWFVEPIYHISARSHYPVVQLFNLLMIFSVPFFEAAIGILLLFPKGRAWAAAMALTMLIVVLLCLGPLGRNWGEGVWPWNIWLFLMEYRLFYQSSIGVFPIFARGGLNMLGVVLFVFAPVLAIWSPWYSYPGFKLYAGSTLTGYVHMPVNESLARAPDYVKRVVLQHRRDRLDPSATQDKRIHLFDWSNSEGTNRYPVAYAFTTGASGLCPYLDYPDKATLEIVYPAPFYNTDTVSRFTPLCPKTVTEKATAIPH